MSPPSPIENDATQRRFHRFPAEGSVRLYSGTTMWNSRLVDLSLSGVLVEKPAAWDGTAGTRYRLDLRLDGGVLIGMGVELVRVDARELAFSCIKIDLGSFTQLKRLIELNLGNNDALRRELSELGL